MTVFSIQSAWAAGLNDTSDAKSEAKPELIWFPVVFYTPETSIAAGVVNIANFWTEKTGKTSHLMSTVYLTKNGQSALSLSPKLYFKQGTHELIGTLKLSYFPSKFFGRSKESALSTPESFLEKDQLLSAGFGHQFFLDYFVRGSLGYQHRELSYEETLPHERLQQEFLQTSKNLEVHFLSLSIDWDDRDYPQSPRSGSWYRWVQTFYQSTNNPAGFDELRFTKSEIDLRRYTSIDANNTFATEFYYAYLSGQKIPFSYLLSVGGNQKLRGFFAGRFLGEASALIQLENRTEINDRWAWAQFFSLGRISDSQSSLGNAENLITGGVGLHYYLDPKNRTKLRLDLGFAESRPGFYFIFAEAF